jgi:hypothetical protein
LSRLLRTFSADPPRVEVCRGAVGCVRVAVRDALGDPQRRPGCVVMLLVLGQDGAQVRLAEDQHPVQELAARGLDEPSVRRSRSSAVTERRCAGLAMDLGCTWH